MRRLASYYLGAALGESLGILLGAALGMLLGVALGNMPGKLLGVALGEALGLMLGVALGEACWASGLASWLGLWSGLQLFQRMNHNQPPWHCPH